MWGTLNEETGQQLVPDLPDTIAVLRLHGELDFSDTTAALVCSMSATIDRPPGRGPLEPANINLTACRRRNAETKPEAPWPNPRRAPHPAL